MTNSKELFNELVASITAPYEADEVHALIYQVLMHEYQLSRTEILTGKEIDLPQTIRLDSYIKRINQYEPIQYILGEAFFWGRTLQVNPSVLIPRPETEILVEKICQAAQKNSTPELILDIGTGSGCIAISLALELPASKVFALDISTDALTCARQNADALHVSVDFFQLDILQEDLRGSFDLIVSNPPYISSGEKMAMSKNVLDYEPHLALFAPGDDPLVFYRAIAKKARATLNPGGSLWFEINEFFGHQISDILHENNYHAIHLIQDLDNKNRIITARV